MRMHSEAGGQLQRGTATMHNLNPPRRPPRCSQRQNRLTRDLKWRGILAPTTGLPRQRDIEAPAVFVTSKLKQARQKTR